MPKLPTYGQPQIQSNGLQGGAQPQVESGVAKGFAVANQLIQIGGQQYEKVKAESDQLEANTAINEQLSFDADASQQVADSKGLDAKLAADQAAELRKEKVQEIADGMKSDRARRAFLMNADHTQVSFTSATYKHASDQTQVAIQASLDDREVRITRKMDESGGDQATLQEGMEALAELGRERARISGLPPDAEISKALSAGAVAAINDRISKRDSRGAAEMLAGYKDFMDPKTVAHYEAQAAAQNDDNLGTTLSAQATDMFTNKVTREIDRDAARRWLEAHPDLSTNPQARNIAKSTFDHNVQEITQGWASHDESVTGPIILRAIKTGNTSAAISAITSRTDVSGQHVAQTVGSLRSLAIANKQLANESTRESNAINFAAILMNQSALQRMTPSEILGLHTQVSNDQLVHIASLHAQLQNAPPATVAFDDATFQSIAFKAGMLDKELKPIGKHKDTLVLAKAGVSEQIAAEQQALGAKKVLSPERKKEIMLLHLTPMTGAVPTPWYKMPGIATDYTSKAKGTLDAVGGFSAVRSAIPASELTALKTEILRKNPGMTDTQLARMTDPQIVEAHMLWKKQQEDLKKLQGRR